MTVYHVDKYYGKEGKVYYDTMPYSLKGTIRIYFGVSFKVRRFMFSFNPWYSRYIEFFKWMKNMRFSEIKANRLCNKLNSRLGGKNENCT